MSFVAAALIGGLVVLTLGGRPSAPPADDSVTQAARAPRLTMRGLVPVAQMPAAERIRLGGYVEALRSVQLTAQAPGRVVYVAGDEGERVQSGQVVVALDQDALEPQYRAAWADLGSQMSGQQNAQAQLYQNLYGQRTSPMGGPGYDAYERTTVPIYNMAQGFMGSMFPGMGQGASSPVNGGPMMTQQQAQHDNAANSAARYDYERQLAGLAGAQAHIDQLDAQSRDRRAMAPWGAAIMKRYVRVGDMVQPGQPLADLADVDQLDVRIEVPVALVANLKVGDQVPVTLGNSNVWAPVAQIFPGASNDQHTVTVKLALPQGSVAAPGMYALAWIAQPGGGSPSQLTPAIPTSAIVRRGSLPVAFVVNAQGGVEMRVLRLGDAQGTNTAILSGVAPGEMVVADPSPALRAGSAPDVADH
jgi:RND family efflux transporter MFP subunit